MKLETSDKKTRDLLAQLYRSAFCDGRAEKKDDIDFGRANISIEDIAIQLGCKPPRMKRAEPIAKRLKRKLAK